MSDKKERRTLSVNEKRVLKIDKCVNEVNRDRKGKAIIWTDLVNHLIDNYIDEAVQDLIHEKK